MPAPAGFTEVISAPSGFTETVTDDKPPMAMYDYDSVRRLLLKHGASPKEASDLAHVSMAESSGNPGATNQYVQDGKTYHVAGLFQISDINGNGNYADPDTAAITALHLYRTQGLVPWASSQYGGVGGGWGQYVNDKPTANPADFAKTLNRPIVQAAGADELQSPAVKAAPPGFTETVGSSNPMTGGGGSTGSYLSDKPRTDKPGPLDKAAKSAGSAIGSFVEGVTQFTPAGAPFGAALRDLEQDPRGPVQHVIHEYTDPVDSAHLYGSNAPNSEAAGKLLTQGSAGVHRAQEGYGLVSPQHGDPIKPVFGAMQSAGRALSSLPPETEMFTPGARELGGALSNEAFDRAAVDTAAGSVIPGGEVLGIAGDAVRGGAKAAEIPLSKGFIAVSDMKNPAAKTAVKIVTSIESGLAPYNDVRRAAIAAGQDPNVAEIAARRAKSAPENAAAASEEIAKNLFKGYTNDEAIQAIRLRQGATDVVDPTGKIKDLAERMNALIHRVTGEKFDRQLLTEDQIFNPDTYFPMKGAYKDPFEDSRTAGTEDYMLAPSQAKSAQGVSKGTANQRKFYQTYDEAKASGNLKDDFDVRDQLKKFLTEHGRAVIREDAYRQLRDLGLLPALPVIDASGNVLGFGKVGEDAAGRVAKSAANIGSHDDAFEETNRLRARDGLAPYSRAEFGELRTAQRTAGRDFVRAQAADRAVDTAEKTAGKAGAAAQAVNDRAGQILLDNLNKNVQQLDKLNARIAKMRETAHQGDIVARGRALAASIAQRDKLAQQIETLQSTVQKQASRTYAKVRTVKTERLRPGGALINSHDLEANRGGEALPKREPAGMGSSQIYAPVVGKLQEIADMVAQMPKSPLRGQILRKLGSAGDKGVKMPSEISDTIARRGAKIQMRLQRAMSAVSQAGADPSAQRILAELEKASKLNEAAIAKASDKLYDRKDRIAEPAKRLTDKILFAGTKERDRAERYWKRVESSRTFKYDLRVYQNAFKKANHGRANAIKGQIITKSQKLAMDRTGMKPARYAPGAEGNSSPTLRYGMARPELLRFLHNMNKESPKWQTDGIGGFIDKMNSLARIGVITNPVIHAGWNLGTHFLASGGSPEFLGTRLWLDPQDWPTTFSRTFHKEMSGFEWQQLAEQNAAVIHNASESPIFGEKWADTFLDPMEIKQFPRWMNQAVSKLWAQNQRVVFKDFETRYSTELFRHFVENKGLSPAEAGIAVRKALGDYANISKTGIDGALSQVMFFYTWMKTALPFWARMVAERPQFITVPGLGTHEWNEASGDPNADKEPYGAIYEGPDGKGGSRMRSFPGPQKWAKDLFDIVSPSDGSDGISPGSMLKAVGKVGLEHIKPFGGIPSAISGTMTYASQAMGKPQDPNAFNHVAFNTNADRGTQLGQIAGDVAGSLPGAEPIGQLATGIGDALHGDFRRLDPVGGFEYDKDPRIDKEIAKAQNAFNARMAHARKIMAREPERAYEDIKRARDFYARDIQRIHGGTAKKGPPPGFTQDVSPDKIPAGFSQSVP